MKSMPLAFVAGATGYTGHAVVEALRRRGIATLAHVRPDSPELDSQRAAFQALGAEVDTTSWDAEAMHHRFVERQPELVFALLGTTRARGARDGGTYESVDYRLTALLIDACGRAGIRPRFVYLSALGADRPRGAYLRARARAEATLRASGLPYLIARPSFISGPDRRERRFGERLAATIADAVLGALARVGARRLRDTLASLSAAQLAEGLVRLALAPAGEQVVVTAAELRGS